MHNRTRVHRTGTSSTRWASTKRRSLLWWLALSFILFFMSPIFLGAGWIVLNKIVRAHTAESHLLNAEMLMPIEIVKQAREIDE